MEVSADADAHPAAATKSPVGLTVRLEARYRDLRRGTIARGRCSHHQHFAVRLAHRSKRAVDFRRRLLKREWHASDAALTEPGVEAKGRGIGRRHRRERERHRQQATTTGPPGRTHASTIS
jgi:hypothetical protein